MLNAINGALQELYGDGSPWMKKVEKGVLLHPPREITMHVANGVSEAMVPKLEWNDWFAGCEVDMAGMPVRNRILNDANQVQLKFPFVGDDSSGTVSATVYHTSVELGERCLRLIGPVMIDGVEIGPRNADSTLEIVDHDFGHLRIRTNRPEHMSVAYDVETWSPDDNVAPRPRLTLTHYPVKASFLSYSVMEVPLVITSLASNATLPIPAKFVQSVFMPVARQILSSCPFFVASTGVEEIYRSYQKALALLKGLSPKTTSGIRLIPIH